MGQGGYSAGVLAEAIGSTVTVRFHSPVPLDQPLRIERHGDTTNLLSDGVAVLSAQPGSLQNAPPAPVEPAAAATGRRWAESRFLEPARSCFSCGSGPDSLRIHAGQVDDSRFATPFTPPPWVANADGEVRLPFVWAPLDCAAGWHVALDQSDPRLAVTGWLIVVQHRPLLVGRDYVVVTSTDPGWEGRKRGASSAIYDRDGALCASSSSLWISV
jgi:hypothetical protein